MASTTTNANTANKVHAANKVSAVADRMEGLHTLAYNAALGMEANGGGEDAAMLHYFASAFEREMTELLEAYELMTD